MNSFGSSSAAGAAKASSSPLSKALSRFSPRSARSTSLRSFPLACECGDTTVFGLIYVNRHCSDPKLADIVLLDTKQQEPVAGELSERRDYRHPSEKSWSRSPTCTGEPDLSFSL